MRISCPPKMIPAPGQYLLASHDPGAPLPIPIFYTDLASGGFIAAAAVPADWSPGLALHLRGPLGRGFTLPVSARRVGLVALDGSPAYLQGLIRPALEQGAAVVLVCDSLVAALPDEVEAQPLALLDEIIEWADYLAFGVGRENLSSRPPLAAGKAAQILVRTPVPCGGLAECGVCAVTTRNSWKMACKDGPVFDWREL